MLNYQECFDLVEHESTRPKIDALKLLALLSGKIHPDRFNTGRTFLYARADEPEYLLRVADPIIGTMGVESVELPDGTYLEYCNAGETYASTLCYKDGEFFISSWGDVYEEAERIAENEAEPQQKALAKHLETSAIKIQETSTDTYEAEDHPGEYLVLNEDDADTAWDESLESYIDECILPEMPDHIRTYFDFEGWKRDAKMDGRGHSLSGYDGEEHEEDVDGETYYIYRVN